MARIKRSKTIIAALERFGIRRQLAQVLQQARQLAYNDRACNKLNEQVDGYATILRSQNCS